MIAVAGHIQH